MILLEASDWRHCVHFVMLPKHFVQGAFNLRYLCSLGWDMQANDTRINIVFMIAKLLHTPEVMCVLCCIVIFKREQDNLRSSAIDVSH